MKINKYNDFRNISSTVLKELRQKANLSQQDLAEKLQLLGIELTSKEISKIENNNRLVQDFELFAFAKIFNVSADIFNKNCSKCSIICYFFMLSNIVLTPSQNPAL